MYGTMNALPKLIDDRSVRTKDIRAFLEREFPPESLPSVEEARALVAAHRKAQEQFAKAQQGDRALKKLEAAQALRREKLLGEQAAMRERQRQERAALEREQLAARRVLRSAYLAQVREVRAARGEARPTGLAAFLGRVSGVSFMLGRLHRHRDARAMKAFVQEKAGLALAQKAAGDVLQRRQELQAMDMARQVKALGKVEVREKQALDVKKTREQRVHQRRGVDHMPALNLDLRPKGRGAAVMRAKDRYRDRTGRAEEREEERAARAEEREMRAALREEERRHEGELDLQRAMQEAMERQEPWSKEVDVAGDFARAAGDGSADGGDGGGDGVPAPRISRAERKADRERSKRKGRDDDFEREM
jgi:hypothetical protein